MHADINTFTNQVIEVLSGEHEEINFRAVETKKNNGILLHGIVFEEKESNIAPSIYVNQYYEDHLNGEEFFNIVDKIWDSYLEARENCPVELVNIFSDYEKVKEKLRVKVINTERNQEYLTDKVNMPFGDLSAIFLISSGDGSIAITKKLLEQWDGITEEDLIKDALKMNHEKLIIKNMFDILKGFFSDTASDEELEDMLLANPPDGKMFVASTKDSVFGASAILDIEMLSKFAKSVGNFFILPSSLHEIILVPDDGHITSKDLGIMVMEVNCTQVAPEDFLSDTVYYYDLQKNSVLIAETKEVIVA